MDKNKISSNRTFGIFFFIIFFIIGIYPTLDGGNFRYWSLIICFLFLILGLKNSKILFPLNKFWLKLGLFLGRIFSPIVMGMIFFLLITPIGLIMRVFKKDLLNLRYNKSKSYWIKKKGSKSLMKNQF